MPSRCSLNILVVAVAALGLFGLTRTAQAADSLFRFDRRGLQVEGFVGGAACLRGRVQCQHDSEFLSGHTRPSFATGVTVGVRPVKWLMIGGLYRWGMFNPALQNNGEDLYTWGGQHSAMAVIRPILPLWRFDLGFNIAPGYSRQVFRRIEGNDRDYSQGFSLLVGPTVDIFLTKNLFIGAEVDFILNTQRRSCRQRGTSTECFDFDRETTPAPTHQTIFGVHLGRVFF